MTERERERERETELASKTANTRSETVRKTNLYVFTQQK